MAIVVLLAVGRARDCALAAAATSGGGALSGGCTRETFPERRGASTSRRFPKGFKYNSVPADERAAPTAVPAIWNVYDEPVEEMLLVHNLEHGGIVVQYGDQVSAETVDQTSSRGTRRTRTASSWRRCPALEDKVAVTAWTQLMTCPGFSRKPSTRSPSLPLQGPASASPRERGSQPGHV